VFCVQANALEPCCSQFWTHPSHVLHVVSLPHVRNGEQQFWAMHWSQSLLLVVAHATLTPHMPALHVFEQHSLADEHVVPSGLHGGGGGGGGGVPHVPFSVQACEQHCCGEVHAAPSGLHDGTPPMHVAEPGSHSCEQHSLADEHFVPFALQSGGGCESLFESGPPESTPESEPSSIFPPHAMRATDTKVKASTRMR
jgi:hypothetical protein